VDCSAIDALTVSYTKYLGLPLEDLDYYGIAEVRLECTDQVCLAYSLNIKSRLLAQHF
jgi:hypothetical protein